MLHGTLIAPDESQFASAPSKFAGLTTGTAPATGDIVVIPDAFLLFNCEFKRVGDDLKLVGADGRTHMVADYFKGDTHPTLATAQGAQIPGSVIDALAGSQAPGQYAQAGAQPGTAEAIGKVATATGNATIVRNGVAIAVNSGDVVLKNDVMRTGGDGALGVTFNDGTTFSLSANAQMAVNDFVYQDGGSNNQAVFNLVRGSISFFASQVAKTGDMKVTTPTATMGIRGTTVVVDIVVDTVNPTSIGQVKIKLYADSNGNVGRVEVSTIGGAPLGVLTATATGFVITPAGAQPNVQQEQVSQQEAARDMALLQALFNSTDIGNQLLQQQGGPQDPNNPNPNTNGSNGSSTDPNVIITVNQTQNGDGTTTTTVAGVTINPPGNASPGSEGGGITPDTSTPTPAPTPIVVDTTNTPPVTITHLTTAQDSNSVAESGVWFGNFPWHGDPVATGNVLANDEDLFPGEAGLHVTTIAAAQGPSTAVHSSFGTVIQGKYGFLWMRPDGSYVYTLNNNDPDTQGLNFGEKGTDVFTYTVMDEDGHYATETLAIDVHGANDAPVIFGGASTGLVIEDGIGWQGEPRGTATASGTLYKFDVDNNDDASNDSWSVVRGYGQTLNQDGSVTGRYGRLEVDQNGQWTYTLDDCDPDTQGLGLGQTGYEIFTIKVTDQYGASDTQTIRVTVRGSSDETPNQAPQTNDTSAQGASNEAIYVQLSGSDPEDETVTRFRITELPDAALGVLGTEFSGSFTVFSVGDIIDRNEIVFRALGSWSGEVAFEYAAIDNNNGEDATPATGTITVDLADVTATVRTESGFDMDTIVPAIVDGHLQSFYSGGVTLLHDEGLRIEISGRNLQFQWNDDEVTLLGGWFTGFAIKDEGYNTLFEATGFNVSAAAMQAAIDYYDSPNGDMSEVEALFSEHVYHIYDGDGADTLIGGDFGDIIVSESGADTILAGDGDDIIVVRSNDPWTVNGGAGVDTLRFEGAFNLPGEGGEGGQQSDQEVTGVEIIDLGANGANNVTIDAHDIREMSLGIELDAIRVLLGPGDVLTLVPGDQIGSWSIAETDITFSDGYTDGVVFDKLVFSGDSTTLYVQHGVGVII